MKKHDTESMRAQIRQGTLHLIASGGMSNFSFPKLTAVTGLVPPTVYELYKNKEELLTTFFLEIDAEISWLLTATMKRMPPHVDQVEDVENYCWLLWVTYWRYLMEDADRTLFCRAFCSSEYYTERVIQKRCENYRSFAQRIDELDRRFHISERGSVRVLVMHLIEGTMSAAVRVFRGELGNDDVTINTIYYAIFQPVFALMETGN